MITHVIKSDGSVEPFSNEKLNKWAEITAEEDVSWSELAITAYKKLDNYCTSKDLHNAMIMACMDIGTEASLRVAGKLLVSNLYKEAFGGFEKLPTLKHLVDNVWDSMSYSDEEVELLDKVIDHSKDMSYNYTSLRQMKDRYLMKDVSSGKIYESPQFMFMGIAMAAMETRDRDVRIQDVINVYHYLSDMKINLPTPMLINLRTDLRGYSSCAVFNVGDTVESIDVGNSISFLLTAKSAGIGGYIGTRSRGDSVKGGRIRHTGKIPLYRSIESAVHAMLQNGSRGGAATLYYSALDPELEDLIQLKNPMTIVEKQVRGIDYALIYNNSFAKAVANNGKWLLISQQKAPDLHEAMFSGDSEHFDMLLEKYWDKGVRVKARDIALRYLTQSVETGRKYLFNAEEVNKHTPFKDTIYSSNLCAEIALPTKPYVDTNDLHSETPNGEIGLCSLASVVESRIESDEEYEDVAYYCLLIIDRVIEMMDYPFKSLETTAKYRRSAGVGITNLAHSLASKGLNYSNGKQTIHDIAERHSYMLHKASLKLAKEIGVCEGMGVSRYKDGWLPIDTYNRNVDELVTGLKYDWESLREDIIKTGGIRNSVLEAFMPNESSSGLTSTTNSLYPIRQNKIAKSSGSNRNLFIAPDSETLDYQFAWDVPSKDLIDMYAIFQKFCGQAISADLYLDLRKVKEVSSRKLLQDFLYMTRMGVKTRYYMNSATGNKLEVEEVEEVGCAGGGCTL